jgi:hypothetical protein
MMRIGGEFYFIYISLFEILFAFQNGRTNTNGMKIAGMSSSDAISAVIPRPSAELAEHHHPS